MIYQDIAIYREHIIFRTVNLSGVHGNMSLNGRRLLYGKLELG